MDANYQFTCHAKEEDINAHRSIVDHLRKLNALAITLNGNTQELEQLAEQIGTLTEAFTPLNKHRLREYFTPLTKLDIQEGLQPYAPFGGSHNPITPQLYYSLEGDSIVAEGEFGLLHEGPIGCLHGGMIAGIYDCVLAAVVIHHGFGGPTAQLNTRYIAPTPLHKPLRFSAKLDRVEGNKVYVVGECHCEGKLVSSADALFINNHKRPV